MPQESEILEAFTRLYADRTSWQDFTQGMAEKSTEGEVGCEWALLEKACDGSSRLTVIPEEGGEWSALLVGESDNFVDVFEKHDPYPEELWLAAEPSIG